MYVDNLLRVLAWMIRCIDGGPYPWLCLACQSLLALHKPSFSQTSTNGWPFDLLEQQSFRASLIAEIFVSATILWRSVRWWLSNRQLHLHPYHGIRDNSSWLLGIARRVDCSPFQLLSHTPHGVPRCYLGKISFKETPPGHRRIASSGGSFPLSRMIDPVPYFEGSHTVQNLSLWMLESLSNLGYLPPTSNSMINQSSSAYTLAEILGLHHHLHHWKFSISPKPGLA